MKHAKKCTIDGRDVCIMEQDLQEEFSGLVESVVTCLYELCICHLEASQYSGNTCEVTECQELSSRVYNLLNMLREAIKKIEDGQIVNDILYSSAFILIKLYATV